MSRMFLVWSFLFGLALVAPIDTLEHGRGAPGVAAAPSDSEGLVTATDDGTPIPRPPK